MMKKQVRIKYNNDRPDSVFGPYFTLKSAEDMASTAFMYGTVDEVIVEKYDGDDIKPQLKGWPRK